MRAVKSLDVEARETASISPRTTIALDWGAFCFSGDSASDGCRWDELGRVGLGSSGEGEWGYRVALSR